jgi:uncharacterized protein (TIGR00255 family)
MTGFGKATAETGDKKFVVEIKSLNSKQLDISTRVPGVFREKDIEIRTMLSQRLQRGKVEFSLYSENLATELSTVINQNVLGKYVQQIKTVAENLSIPEPQDFFGILLKMPDVMKSEIQELNENEWPVIFQMICDALDQLDSFRDQEGVSIYNDIKEKVDNIVSYYQEVPQFEQERIETMRNRLTDAVADFKGKVEFNPERLEQEMIFYLEKLDINEEKVRLHNHCIYFVNTMNLDEPVGRKLGFIAQEMGREINTLGSKANHAELQKLVIKMKDELEKIKEQLGNVL